MWKAMKTLISESCGSFITHQVASDIPALTRQCAVSGAELTAH